jgi:stalled ribosome alternative rescue factor ArfA
MPLKKAAKSKKKRLPRTPLPRKPPKVERPKKGKGSYTRKEKHRTPPDCNETEP